LRIYSQVFTSYTIDNKNNYEVYELLGDLSGNKFIGWYFVRRFPFLNCSDGVKVLARLKINYGAKKSFSSIADSLGFWDYISATNELRKRSKKSLLEDVFEAFIGATEWMLDEKVKGLGWSQVYKIMESVFNQLDISLEYDKLFDAKTRLKETVDMFGQEIGLVKYENDREDLLVHSKVILVVGGEYERKPNGTINKRRIVGGKNKVIGNGTASTAKDAEQYASQQALNYLTKKGIMKKPPRIYKYFSQGKVPEEPQLTVEDIKTEMKALDIIDINTMIQTKKTKYQVEYKSTLLCKYCRLRNESGVKACIQLNANPNISDSNGLTPIDLLFLGKIDRKTVRPILSALWVKSNRKEIHANIYENYYLFYKSKFYETKREKLTVIN